MEIIEGVEVMNSELVDQLYDKSKEVVSRRLDQLRLEKEQKNILKDELTRVLKVYQAQENQLIEYKAMVETVNSSKRNLKREFKIGRSGGAHWPLWVTEVCCELLVNGLPPLAIPSSIGTLLAALYGEGEETTRLPLLN